MAKREVISYGQMLSIVGTSLTTSFQGGTAIALMGAEELDVELLATFDAATTLTNLIFQFQVSDDGTNWEPLATVQASTGTYTTTATVSAAAGTTVRDRVQISDASVMTFRNAKMCRIAVKTTGASKSGDAATAQLKYSV
jgi:hypothetical protein